MPTVYAGTRSEPIVELLRTGRYRPLRATPNSEQGCEWTWASVLLERELSKNLTEAVWSKNRPEIGLETGGGSPGGGQLLRPDEDTLASASFVVDDQGRTVALEVLDGEPHVAEIERSWPMSTRLPRIFSRSSQNGMSIFTTRPSSGSNAMMLSDCGR